MPPKPRWISTSASTPTTARWWTRDSSRPRHWSPRKPASNLRSPTTRPHWPPLSRLELEALLNPADSVAVQVGQKAQLTIEGIPAPVPATVVRINPSAQAGSRTVPVYLRVEQAPGATPLRQGLFVQGTLDTGRADVLAVPLDAVRTDKPAPYLQTLKDGRVVYAPVKTGTRAVVSGQTLVAVEGVPEGTVVIAGRIGLLREGTAVAVAASAATAAAAPALAAASRAAP